MEFLRFGSSIPGTNWGCCAIDIIQCFDVDLDEPASIQLVSGDGGTPMGDKFLGKTHREIFLQRLRIATFSSSPMPDHVFLAAITSSQIRTTYGKKWLEILKEQGFEFIRATGNSVYTTNEVPDTPSKKYFDGDEVKVVYLFGLFRNISKQPVNPKKPPEYWETLPDPYKGRNKRAVQIKHWNSLPETKFYTEAEIEAASVPITYAGIRSKFPQQLKKARKRIEEVEKKSKEISKAFSKDPFGKAKVT